MRLIDADRLYNTIIDEIDPISISMDGCEMRGMMRTIIAAAPTIEAVPLDKLCEYLNSVIYPCIICKESPGPQCDAKRKGCWERVLTKWTEGLDADRP